MHDKNVPTRAQVEEMMASYVVIRSMTYAHSLLSSFETLKNPSRTSSVHTEGYRYVIEQ